MKKTSSSERFASRLGSHLDAVGWNQARLSRETKISEAQISGWLGRRKGAPSRSVGRHHVNAVAWALAGGYREQQSRTFAPEDLDSLLFDLLEAAGFSTSSGKEDTALWRRLSAGDRTLTLGWAPYAPFATENLKGFSIELTERIAQLLGLELDWKRYRWADLIEALNSREIDLIAPIFLTFPNRMFQVRFSDPIPNLFVGLNAVVHRQHLPKVRREATFALEHVRLACVSGEIGQIMCALLAPGAQREEPPFETVEEGCRDVLSHPIDESSSRVRCFVADDVACHRFLQQNRHAALVLPQGGSPVRLALAFATQLGEARFVEILNACISRLAASSALDALFSAHKSDLEAVGIHPK